MRDLIPEPAQEPSCDERGWCHANAEGVVLDLYVQPNARVTEAVGEHDGALKIRLHAPPIDGRANEALLAGVATRLSLARRQIVLKSGQSSRRKRIQILALGLDVGELARKLSA